MIAQTSGLECLQSSDRVWCLSHGKCVQIEQRRQVLRLAGMEPHREPVRPLVHWDFVLKEMRWMAVDFTEVCKPALINALCLAADQHSRPSGWLPFASPTCLIGATLEESCGESHCT